MLRIEEVRIYEIFLEFTGDYTISQRHGIYSDNNIIVEVITNKDNVKGYGEGVPVEVVTGETQKSSVLNVLKFVQSCQFPWELNNEYQVWEYIDNLPMGMENNAAICAIETALLDALGKVEKKSILAYFPQDHYSSSINYGASITLGDEVRITELCLLIKGLGIKDLRLKFSGDFEQNKVTIEIVRKIFGEDCDIRVDPNRVWDKTLTLKHIPLILKHKVKIVEEPMSPHDKGFQEVVRLLKNSGIILMACESVRTLAEIERIIDEGFYQMINVKLNRSGGFRRSMKMIDRIRKEGLLFQIGCTLGESGILSAGGRALSLLCSDAQYYDGSYDSFILKNNITKEDVTFGQGGKAGPLSGFGLGVEVSRERLAELQRNLTTIRREA